MGFFILIFDKVPFNGGFVFAEKNYFLANNYFLRIKMCSLNENQIINNYQFENNITLLTYYNNVGILLKEDSRWFLALLNHNLLPIDMYESTEVKIKELYEKYVSTDTIMWELLD